jgi:hypothetical protein
MQRKPGCLVEYPLRLLKHRKHVQSPPRGKRVVPTGGVMEVGVAKRLGL